MSHLTRALALLVGLAALVATPPAVASYDGPTHSGPSHQHGNTTDSTVSTGHHQVRHIRRATARFHNIATAETAGYVLLKDLDAITCIDMPGLGGMGVHYVKPELIANPAIRAGSPEALVYAPDRDGTLRLAALEYLVDRAAWDAQHPGVLSSSAATRSTSPRHRTGSVSTRSTPSTSGPGRRTVPGCSPCGTRR